MADYKYMSWVLFALTLNNMRNKLQNLLRLAGTSFGSYFMLIVHGEKIRDTQVSLKIKSIAILWLRTILVSE
mgnify:CR=1 FL=1